MHFLSDNTKQRCLHLLLYDTVSDVVEMYVKAKNQPFGRGNGFSPKKHLKTAFSSGQKPVSALEGAGGQTVDTRSIFGVSLNILRQNSSN